MIWAPGWLRGLSLCIKLRSWSQGPGIEPYIGLSAQWGACFLLSLCLPLCGLVISACQINKIFRKIRLRIYPKINFSSDGDAPGNSRVQSTQNGTARV